MGTITRLLVFRHAEHGVDGVQKNVLPDRERDRMIRTGAFLKERGLVPSLAISSPAGRCLETTLCLLRGTGSEPVVRTDDRLAYDVPWIKRLISEEEVQTAVDALPAHVREAPMDADLQVTLAILHEPRFKERVHSRAEQAIAAIFPHLLAHPGGVVLACTHAVTGEALLHWLVPASEPAAFLFRRGDCVSVQFDLGETPSLKRVDFIGRLVD